VRGKNRTPTHSRRSTDPDPDRDPDLDETMKPETLKPKRVEDSTALFRING
jgi:hypothetical protein